ncbi:MAG: flagellar hook-length control protein FliK [Ketobacter sp.]|nr:flagellar hook-length control protein FliK [Ketobacter sp.]
MDAKQRNDRQERLSRAEAHRDQRTERNQSRSEEAQDSQHRAEQANAQATDKEDRLNHHQRAAKDQEKALTQAEATSAQVSSEAAQAGVSTAQAETPKTDSIASEAAIEGSVSSPEIQLADGEQEGDSEVSDAVATPHHSPPELANSESLSADESLPATETNEQSDAEQQALAAVANGQGDVQGEADSDKVVEPVTAAILGAAAKGMKGKPGAEVQATAGDTKKPELTASATRVATASELGAGEKSESGEKQARQSSPMTAEVDDVALADSKQEKKSDVAMLTEKLASRNGMPENPVPTPVQERLAALAKALDKAAGVGKDTSQPVPKAVEQADGTKATPFQRSLEQVGRSSATMAKPFATPIQTPMQSREWGNEVGQRLMMMVSSKLNSAQIQLTPRDMGPIDVKVSVQQDQANVVFTSHAAPTRDALEQALPRLRELMEQNGVALGDVDVRDQNAQESHDRRGQDHRSGSGSEQEADAVVQTEAAAEGETQHAVGLVDYYA